VLLQIMKNVKSIKQCDSGLGEELSQMRELYRREALQRKLLYNQVRCHSTTIIVVVVVVVVIISIRSVSIRLREKKPD